MSRAFLCGALMICTPRVRVEGVSQLKIIYLKCPHPINGQQFTGTPPHAHTKTITSTNFNTSLEFIIHTCISLWLGRYF